MLAPARALIVALSMAVAACGSTTTTQITAPGDVTCAVNATAPQQLLASGGDRISVAMTTSRDCLWNVVSAASWLQVSPPNGQGGGALVFTAAANPGTEPRVATVSVNGTPITVVQAGLQASAPTFTSPPSMAPSEPTAPSAPSAPGPSPVPVVSCTPSVSPTGVAVGSGGGNGVISVSIGAGCRWSSTSTVGWIDITSGTTGSGPGSVAYSVAKHNGKGGRTGGLVVAGVAVTVTQAGKD